MIAATPTQPLRVMFDASALTPRYAQEPGHDRRGHVQGVLVRPRRRFKKGRRRAAARRGADPVLGGDAAGRGLQLLQLPLQRRASTLGLTLPACLPHCLGEGALRM